MFGGGPELTPGEVTLAHNGVLFLDDALEFKSSVLQMLRVPVERGQMMLSRAGRATVFPAGFQLVMSVRPCPCGNCGSSDRLCLCSADMMRRYRGRMPEQLAERFAVICDCGSPSIEGARTLAELRGMIRTAWEAQYSRQGTLNQRLRPFDLPDNLLFSAEARSCLDRSRARLKPRTMTNVCMVARTVADMHGREEVGAEDVQTALDLGRGLPLPWQDD
jgi:magnesium chelatase family protein